MGVFGDILKNVGGLLVDKFVHFKDGGIVNVKGGKKAVVVVHDGEMVVPKKDVKKVKKAMKKEKVKVPKVKNVKAPRKK